MSLAKKLLNKSINFEEKKSSVDNIKNCIVAVIAFDCVIVEYNDRNNRREITQEVLRLNANEFITFLKEARSLEMISVFDTGSAVRYTRLELLKEIAERKRAFFTNEDRRSFLDMIEAIPEKPKEEREKPQRKTDRDKIEEMKKNGGNSVNGTQNGVTQGNSKRSLIVRTGNDRRKEATQIKFL